MGWRWSSVNCSFAPYYETAASSLTKLERLQYEGAPIAGGAVRAPTVAIEHEVQPAPTMADDDDAVA